MGELVGFAIQAQGMGYQDVISVLYAYSPGEDAVTGFRVLESRETPGLGDYIETRKDKNKSRPWITQFAGMSLATVNDAGWKVRKDGGAIDYYAGATVTPRAVTKAVLKAVKWAEANRNQLFATANNPPGVAK